MSERQEKTLIEVLSEMESGVLVYLGARSSFFDIATAGQLREEKYISNLSICLEELAKRKMESAKANFFAALRNPPTWKEPEHEKDREKSIESYIAMIPRWQKRLKSMQETMVAAEIYVQTFVSLPDRNVKSVYPRIDGTGMCVIVFGNELGGYWDLSEKQSGKGMVVTEDGDAH